jgi:hypothetical protein
MRLEPHVGKGSVPIISFVVRDESFLGGAIYGWQVDLKRGVELQADLARTFLLETLFQ